jgi:hypothetical protein
VRPGLALPVPDWNVVKKSIMQKQTQLQLACRIGIIHPKLITNFSLIIDYSLAF